jgi:MFS superfamily sulfate permease-like transporter
MSADAPDEGTLSFTQWLQRIPRTYELLCAAAAAVLGLFAPDILIPEPLSSYRSLASLMVVVAFVLTWAWRDWLRLHLRKVVTTTAVIFVVFAVLRILFVRPVHYEESPPETKYFLIGTRVVDEDLVGASDEDVIKWNGGSWSDLRQAWGTSFVVVALAYSVSYLLLVQGLILSVGGSNIVRREAEAEGNPEVDAPHADGQGAAGA